MRDLTAHRTIDRGVRLLRLGRRVRARSRRGGDQDQPRDLVGRVLMRLGDDRLPGDEQQGGGTDHTGEHGERAVIM